MRISINAPMSERFTYPGRELEAMAFAENYHRWILQFFEPFLGAHLVEVGAGIGSFSELILRQHACRTLSLVEPSTEMYDQLAAYARRPGRTMTHIETYNATFTEAAPHIKEQQPPDSIIYVNVLEHIADDETELRAIHQTLSGGGRLLLFVPALRWLYGSFDERIGHIRRYAKPELEEKLRHAGFKILKSAYFDFLGIAPWWVKYCVFKSPTMESGAVRFYDQYIIPAARRIETRVPPPIGKNIILVAEKV